MPHAEHQTGKFIVIEGIDGAGSSTQAERLVAWLDSRRIRGVLTAEPSGGPVGSLLRQILTGRVLARRPDGTVATMHNDVIALLFAADRLDHLDCVVRPWIESGAHVVSDRYYHSSLLYQSLSGDREWIRQLNVRARPPDVTYVLDLPAELAAQRRSARHAEELYERGDIQRQLAEGYRNLPRLLPEEEIVLIDGRGDVRTVHDAIVAELTRRFGWG